MPTMDEAYRQLGGRTRRNGRQLPGLGCSLHEARCARAFQATIDPDAPHPYLCTLALGHEGPCGDKAFGLVATEPP